MTDRRLMRPYPWQQGVPETVEAFLRDLGGPALIYVPGVSSGRCRLVVTLLHGNEPSGVMAVHRYLRAQLTATLPPPHKDLYFMVVGVDNALRSPLFSHRQTPGQRDYNRCFLSPRGDYPGAMAADILAWIAQHRPEAVIDIHNTSGQGPDFSVCTELHAAHLGLAGLFTQRVVVTDLRIGALIDTSREDLPVVTIECGGATSELSHQVAWNGLNRFASALDPEVRQPWAEFDLYHHPVRLELAPDAHIAFADSNVETADITLPSHFDQRNFGVVTPDIPLGWVNNPHCLQIVTASGPQPVDDYFLIRRGSLHAAHPLKLFMVTNCPTIARSDCLLYAVKEMDHDHLLES